MAVPPVVFEDDAGQSAKQRNSRRKHRRARGAGSAANPEQPESAESSVDSLPASASTTAVPIKVCEVDCGALAVMLLPELLPWTLQAVNPMHRTTLELRNLPVNYSREMLLGLFNNQGFAGQYDFVFLPIDFGTGENQGIAFVNFVDHIVATQFWDTFHGFSRWWRAWGKEVCNVSWSPWQGLDVHIEYYRNNPIMHESVPDEYKPAIFSDGARCPFPPPRTMQSPPAPDEPMRVSQRDSSTVPLSIPSPRLSPELRTTVVLRNVPCNYTREMLQGLFDNQGFAGQYNFILLPIDFVTNVNKGYAHVNLVNSMVAAQFSDMFHGFSRWWRAWCKEVCEVSWSPLQGFEEHIERYRNSPLMHESVPDQFRPAIFSDGIRCPFPPPTKKVRAPRVRRLGLSKTHDSN